MLKTTGISSGISSTDSANRLIKIWTNRYLPDLALLPAAKGDFPTFELVEFAATAARLHTAEKVKHLLQLNCEIASLKANTLFSYIPNIVDLAETRILARCVQQVYDRMLEIYVRQKPPSQYLKYMDTSATLFSKLALSSLMLPILQQLADELEPTLLAMQNRYRVAKDSRALGFLTTQFHLSTREVFKRLTLSEQVLLTPYFKFVEEQVCIPWQRICAAAANHPSGSPLFKLVEQMIGQSQIIGETVYYQAAERYPTHTSRRGTLVQPAIAASTIRDLNMMQGYLWLCVMEQNMQAIEQELLPLCVMVFPSIDVKSDLVNQMLQLLIDEIHSRLNPQQQKLLSPYTRSMVEIFAGANWSGQKLQLV